MGPGCASPDRRRENGGIALAFSIFRDKAFNGQVLATRSSDGGQSFAELRPITVDNESQRFAALGLDADGSVFAAWIDKRNRVPAQQEGRKYEGAGLFFASSKDGGAVYAEARLAATTPANAAGSVWRSPVPAVPWWCFGTSSKAACGITRS